MIGTIIQAKRKAVGLTQAQLGECLGVTAPAVNRWEKDLSYPDVAILAPLARALKTDLNELFSFYQSLSDTERYLAKDRARTLFIDGKADEAYSYMSEMLCQNPADGQLYLDFAEAIMSTSLIGDNLSHIERLSRLIEYYEKALELLPEQAEDISFTLVGLYGQRGDRAKAENALAQVPERKNDKRLAHVELLHELGLEKEAETELRGYILRKVVDLLSDLVLLESVERALSQNDLAQIARDKQDAVKEIFELWDGVDILSLLSGSSTHLSSGEESVDIPLSTLLDPKSSGGTLSKSPLFKEAEIGGVPRRDATTADLMADVITALKGIKE